MDTTIEKIIGQLVGEASMCWSELPQGVFESDRAKRIVDDIMLILAKQQEGFVKMIEKRMTPINQCTTGSPCEYENGICLDLLADIKSKLK